MTWIVVVTKPNQEHVACLNLKRQGYLYYWPRFRAKRPNKPDSIRSLFPRYLFVNIDKTWYSILSTRGVSKVLILSEGGPAVLPEREIMKLKEREGKDGLISLAPPPPKFVIGDKCKVESGPLVGQILIYEGMSSKERCRVLATMLGGKIPVELDERTLIAV